MGGCNTEKRITSPQKDVAPPLEKVLVAAAPDNSVPPPLPATTAAAPVTDLELKGTVEPPSAPPTTAPEAEPVKPQLAPVPGKPAKSEKAPLEPLFTKAVPGMDHGPFNKSKSEKENSINSLAKGELPHAQSKVLEVVSRIPIEASIKNVYTTALNSSKTPGQRKAPQKLPKLSGSFTINVVDAPKLSSYSIEPIAAAAEPITSTTATSTRNKKLSKQTAKDNRKKQREESIHEAIEEGEEDVCEEISEKGRRSVIDSSERTKMAGSRIAFMKEGCQM